MRSLLHSPLCWFLTISLGFWAWHVWGIISEGRSQRAGVGGQRPDGRDARNTELETRNPEHRTQNLAGCPADTGQKTRDQRQRSLRFAPAALFGIAWLLFAFISAPLGSELLRKSLVQDWSSAPEFSPEYILVASMGYVVTEDPSTNVLRDGTALRVAAGAVWHQEHPDAFLVMQGSSGENEPDDHQARLMAQLAIGLGVPEEKILLEPHSRNTREHVERIREFEGITEATRIGVVTSDWHMRRTAREFRAVFHNVAIRPAVHREGHGISLSSFIPRENYLHASSLYIREWLAIVYYRLTG